jgi:acyl carrier protein
MSATEKTASAAALDEIVALIIEVKPGLADTKVLPSDSLVDDLGLDSLDILQLSRKINRDIGVFDLDSWSEAAAEHGRTVQSLLDTVEE